MLERLQSAFHRACGLDPAQTVLVGVSGGPDSLCLLHALHTLGYRPIAAHLDHRLRPESRAEAQAVERFAAELGVPSVLEEADVTAYVRYHRLSVEEGARAVRYSFLFQQAERLGAQAVAVGHNADDQVETLLMHLLRGAGLDGLRGMAYRSQPNPWSESRPLVRPLLGIWRAEIEAYVAENQLPANFDRSNLDTTFNRNRLRHELIPYLKSYNPRLKEALWRTAEVLREAGLVVESVTEIAWNECVAQAGPGFVAFHAQALNAQPLGVRQALLRQAAAVLRPDVRDIDFDVISGALAFMEAPSRSHRRDLAAGLHLLSEGDRLWLAAWDADLPGQGWPQTPLGFALMLDVPGEISLSGGWILSAGTGSRPPEEDYTKENPYQAWLNAGALQIPLTVRARQPGDRFCPLGLAGHSVKLSEFFIDHRLPRRARDRWPLVLSGDVIAWVPGFRPAHSFRLTPEAQRVVCLRLIPPE